MRITAGIVLVVVLSTGCGIDDASIDSGGPDHYVIPIEHLDAEGDGIASFDAAEVSIDPEVIYYELPTFDPGNYLDLHPKPDPGGDPGPTDTGPPPDTDTTDPGPTIGPCLDWNHCTLNQVCNFALGRCDQRDDVPASPIQIFSYHPREASAGDLLIVDGRRFYSSLFGNMAVSVRIGSVNVANSQLMTDENRVILFLPPGTDGGPITVFGEGGQQVVTAEPLAAAPSGILPCDGSSPLATYQLPGVVSSAGPHAAAFVDLPTEEARIFYPSLCGSLRRPPVPGEHPLVVLLHGNGAGWAGHGYLGQFLATWGFVSLMPKSFNESYEVAPAETAWLIDRIEMIRGKDLGSVSPVLSGVSATAKVAMLGHSRGTARLGHVTDTDSTIAANTVASIYQGPVDDGFQVPGLFLVFGATGDKQSMAMGINMTYGGQPAPKWKVWIQGGNHGGFTDHKVWSGFLDATPTITRRQQMEIVASFVLPLLQRAFGMTENFPEQLDSPPASQLYIVEKEL